MKLIHLFLIVNPISAEIIFRQTLPLFWCLLYILGDSDKYIADVVLLFVYLFINLFLNIILLAKVYKIALNLPSNIDLRRPNSYTTIMLVVILIQIFVIILNVDIIPIIKEGGSDAVVFIGEEHKKELWLFSGVISSFTYILMVFSVSSVSKFMKFLGLFFAALMLALFGKKSAILIVLLNVAFIYFIKYSHRLRSLTAFSLSKLTINKSFLKTFSFLLLLSILSFHFLLVQYYRTLNSTLQLDNILSAYIEIPRLVYNAANLYLHQLIFDQGILLIEEYHNQLGVFGFFKYFLNPVTKFLFGFGIQNSIGPFLSERLYGYDIPFGVNPTLFFEYSFIFGNVYVGFTFSLISIFLLYKAQVLLIKRSVLYVRSNDPSYLILSSFFIYLLNLSISFKYDTLNTIRALPFAFLILIIYYIYPKRKERPCLIKSC